MQGQAGYAAEGRSTTRHCRTGVESLPLRSRHICFILDELGEFLSLAIMVWTRNFVDLFMIRKLNYVKGCTIYWRVYTLRRV